MPSVTHCVKAAPVNAPCKQCDILGGETLK